MRTLIQIVLVLGLVAGGYFGWQQRTELPVLGPYFAAAPEVQRQGARAVPVDAALVKSGRLIDSITVVGSARANESVTITTEVAGRVAEIRFREGDSVPRGAVLVRLDAAEILADRAEAEAMLIRARQLYERGVKLREARAVTVQRTEELAQELAAAEAVVAQIDARLDNYELKAPFPGRLGLRQISPGALVTPGDAIVTLDDISVIKLDFDVPETALAQIHPGLVVQARSAAYPDAVLEGTISTIDSRIDPATRAVTVRAELANPEGLLRPGMFLTVDVVFGETTDAVLIPEEAVMVVDDRAFVFAVVDGKAERRGVRLGRRRPGEVEVVDGLAPGERIIVGGVQKVQPGGAVEVRNAETAER